LALYDSGESKEMLRVATEFSVGGGDRLHKEWMDFYGSIFARLRDYFVIEEDPSDPICNCKVNEGGIPDTWKKRIVDETGSKYECIDDDSVPDLAAVSLKRLRGSTHEKFSMKYFAYAY
jgi:hypothetical protein